MAAARVLGMLGALASLAMAGCGDAGTVKATRKATTPGAPTPRTTTQPRPRAAPAPPKAPGGLGLPAGVPREGRGPAGDAAKRVISGWSDALRAGDVRRAADYFAQPSRVQNATPVVTLASRAERVAFNASFPCGSRATAFSAARGGYTIATFRLTERRHADCMGAAGAQARVAIQVRDGKIAGWYRLPDPSAPLPGSADPGASSV